MRVIVAFTVTEEGPVRVGVAQVPGMVATAADSALVLLASISHLQRVLMLWAGPSWSYTGRVVSQGPLFTWYSRVDPVGQGVPPGAVMLPPERVQAEAQVLLVMVTLAGATLKVGQAGPSQRPIRSTSTFPPPSVKFPPAYTLLPEMAMATAEEFKPVPSALQLLPFQRAIRVALAFPPALIKPPPTYTLLPEMAMDTT